ncbi:MAG: hypothetical protein ABSG53_11170, partial [Thermoguttaceae bacterium]
MLRCSVLSGLVLVFVATISFAQPPGGGGPGFFGGMGMPAGMLLAMPEVQKEIAITDAQKPQVEELRSQTQKDLQEARSGVDFQALRDMSQEERTKTLTELRTKTTEISKQSDAKLEKVLDEKQMKRLKELQIQREGAAAFARPEIVAKLALTDDQKAKIKKIQDDARAQGRGAFNPDATPEERQAAMAKMRETRAKVLKDILATLNSDQSTTWTELTGKEF